MTEGVRKIEIGPGVLITDLGCMVDERNGIVAIADLHIGIEGSALDDGVEFPRSQREDIIEKLEEIITRYSPEHLVIVGDFKHNFDRNLDQEWREVRLILELVMARVRRISIVRGNHDNYLPGILPSDMGLPLKLELGNLCFVHGHENTPINSECITVQGHEHPSILFKDSIGAAIRLPVFLYHSGRKILILPAMSPLTPGIDILSRKFFSPGLSGLEASEFDGYAVSEIGLIGLGKIGGLR
jgi:putative SbcD/Mre11-related phosphoesterase